MYFFAQPWALQVRAAGGRAYAIELLHLQSTLLVAKNGLKRPEAVSTAWSQQPARPGRGQGGRMPRMTLPTTHSLPCTFLNTSALSQPILYVDIIHVHSLHWRVVSNYFTSF